MNASELFVECLETEGVKRIYGVPGEENADFLRALEKSSIEFVMTRHEQGAAFMAAVQGRLTGEVGVCLGTLGPGATNLLTGVADGNMDNAPLLVITGQGARSRKHKESHQMMDVVSMFKPVTKWAQAIETPDSIPEIVRKAVRVATSEKPGAVHIELPEDIASEKVEGAPLKPIKARRPAADEKALEAAIDAISKARSPIIIAGNGTIRKRASKQLRRFCAATGIGALMTFMAKGAVERNAKQCLYTIGLGQKDFPLLALEQSDLIITIGYDMVEYPPKLWNVNPDARILHIDFDAAEIDADYQPDIEVVGDIANTLWRLNEGIKDVSLPMFDFSAQAELREKMQAEFAEHADDASIGKLKPQKILSDVMGVLGPNDILLSGVGAHKMWVARHFQAIEPGTCIISNGFCSMGMPLPGAISASYLFPDRKILASAGDGDFLMNVQEMETAKRLGSNITVLLWEDSGYGLIEWKQEQDFGDHTPLSFDNPDWLKLADAFGWQASRCDDSANFKSALTKALNQSGPSLLVVPVDYRENMRLSKRLGNIDLR